MKSLSGMYVSGPEGVIIAAVMWWMDLEGAGLLKGEADRLNREADPTAFLSKQEGELAEEIGKHVHVEGAFWKALDSEAGARRMVEIAYLADGGRPWAEKRVRDLLLRELAIFLKATDFFTRNRAAIEREKKRVKTVRTVMEL